MLFNNTFTSAESTTESGSFVFDYTNNGYSMGDGSPVLVTGVEAVNVINSESVGVYYNIGQEILSFN